MNTADSVQGCDIYYDPYNYSNALWKINKNKHF